MIITNHTGLPQPLVEAIIKDPYDKGHSDLTVTQLISPPRKVALEKRHDNEMVVDASDRLWALMGQIGHGILERAANSGIVEKRWFGAMDGWVISGQSDLILATSTLCDYKFTSVWTVKDGLKPEWEQQMNLLMWLAESHAQNIKEAQIICIFRDWSVLEARRDRNYPQRQVKVLPVPLWGYEKAEAFARERVRIHAQAQAGELPECTAEERWEKAPVWAVMKKGRKRAVRLYDNERDAVKHATAEKQCSVEHRPGDSIRCQSYCAAAPYCEQWKRMGGGVDMAAQMEDSGEGTEDLPTENLYTEMAKTAAAQTPPAPAAPQVAAPTAPASPPARYDDFPVEQDVAVNPRPQPAKTAAPTPPPKPEAPAPGGPPAMPPPPPAALVGRDEPVNVVDAPIPPMPEVTEIPQ